MFGHHWESAEATIVTSRVIKTTGDGMVSIREYVAEVHPASGPPFRTVVGEPTISTFFWSPSPGDVVTVKVDVERQKAKFDMDDPRLSSRHREGQLRSAAQSGFDAALAGPVAAPIPVESPEAQDPGARLRRLKVLLQDGLIDEHEYEAARAQVLTGI